jgi:RES domain
VVTPPVAEIDWPDSRRIIRTIYPPIWLFEDIADQADWELIAIAEAKTNPRIRDEIGNLSLVPVSRRIAGPGASIVMGAFTHCSVDRKSRFTNGTYGIWYASDRFEVALMETIHHYELFMRRTNEAAADSQFRELKAHVSGNLRDLRATGSQQYLNPDDYGPSQAIARQFRDAGEDGIVYPSVRWSAGQAVALFWPTAVRLPVIQVRHMHYHWDGARVSRYFVYGEDHWYPRPP